MLDTNKIDSDILDEIIRLCEKAMIKPLSKKKPEVDVTVIKKDDDEAPADDMDLAGEEEELSPDNGDDDISDDDMNAMLEEYKNRKGR